MIHNARVNLLAGCFNIMSASTFSVGVVAPVGARVFYGGTAYPISQLALGIAMSFALSVAFHGFGQFVLGGLRDL